MTAWFGNSAGHAKAGRLGGKAQSRAVNPGNFANDPGKARLAGSRKGKGRKPRDPDEAERHRESARLSYHRRKQLTKGT